MNKLMKFANTKAGMIVAIGLVGSVVVVIAAKKATEVVSDTAADIGHAVNPLNDENVFSTGVDAVGAKISGDEHFSLGGWVYDLTHEKYDPNGVTPS